ncbi:hypothetical protein N657DRAFT_135029 [Parathielavia appendiculata]|uniref:Uncharacterized protein n=1 Tax=Parathielavia appendiculata TaxID=2587402 RepID=A0AAN6Z0J2_9PEZI|nr:hypothetical protein N657DRAFT_135029 [Parathielavia appendiculata]
MEVNSEVKVNKGRLVISAIKNDRPRRARRRSPRRRLCDPRRSRFSGTLLATAPRWRNGCWTGTPHVFRTFQPNHEGNSWTFEDSMAPKATLWSLNWLNKSIGATYARLDGSLAHDGLATIDKILFRMGPLPTTKPSKKLVTLLLHVKGRLCHPVFQRRKANIGMGTTFEMGVSHHIPGQIFSLDTKDPSVTLIKGPHTLGDLWDFLGYTGLPQWVYNLFAKVPLTLDQSAPAPRNLFIFQPQTIRVDCYTTAEPSASRGRRQQGLDRCGVPVAREGHHSPWGCRDRYQDHGRCPLWCRKLHSDPQLHVNQGCAFVDHRESLDRPRLGQLADARLRPHSGFARRRMRHHNPTGRRCRLPQSPGLGRRHYQGQIRRRREYNTLGSRECTQGRHQTSSVRNRPGRLTINLSVDDKVTGFWLDIELPLKFGGPDGETAALAASFILIQGCLLLHRELWDQKMAKSASPVTSEPDGTIPLQLSPFREAFLEPVARTATIDYL